jgi:hypothetical protein
MINAHKPIAIIEHDTHFLYTCVTCNFKCDIKSKYNRHLSTAKHTNLLNNKDKLSCECGKLYLHIGSLYNHKKKCNPVKLEKDSPILFELIQKNQEYTLELIEQTNEKTKEQTQELIKQNLELKNILVEQKNILIEQNEKIIELSSKPNIINNNNNTTNFNLSFFLNEDCKNALNIKDFLTSITLNVNDLEETGRLGHVGGITRIILDKMAELNINQRPMHCTDLKRETLYIKDNDIWEKDNSTNDKLAKFVSSVANKNARLLPAWVEQHPNCRDAANQECDDYLKIAASVLGSYEIEDDVNKVVKNVIKNIVVDKIKVKHKSK